MAKLVETTYGEALFELAIQESKIDELCEEAQVVIDVFKDNQDLVKILRSPKVEKGDKEELIKNVFDKFVSKDITGLLTVMVSKDRQDKIVSTLQYFIKRVYEYKKIGVAFVTTARPLTDDQKLSVVSRLLATTDYVDFKITPFIILCLAEDTFKNIFKYSKMINILTISVTPDTITSSNCIIRYLHAYYILSFLY